MDRVWISGGALRQKIWAPVKRRVPRWLLEHLGGDPISIARFPSCANSCALQPDDQFYKAPLMFPPNITPPKGDRSNIGSNGSKPIKLLVSSKFAALGKLNTMVPIRHLRETGEQVKGSKFGLFRRTSGCREPHER